MIKANELRLGNYVLASKYLDNDTQKDEIIVDDINQYRINNKFLHEKIFGIPLTEEWLIKFGFINYNDEYFSVRINKNIRPNNKSYLCFDKSSDIPLMVGIWTEDYENNDYENEPITTWTYLPNIQYVHQLQNLYFALYGTELEIKP